MGGEGQIESQRGGGRHVFCPEDKKHGRKANFAATWWRLSLIHIFHGRIDHDAAQPAPDGSGRTHVGGAGDGFEGAFLDHIHGIIRIFNIGIGQAIRCV